MESDPERQDLTEHQATGTLTPMLAAGDPLAMPSRKKLPANIIHVTEQLFSTQGGGPGAMGLISSEPSPVLLQTPPPSAFSRTDVNI
jgi:hypothetical protein